MDECEMIRERFRLVGKTGSGLCLYGDLLVISVMIYKLLSYKYHNQNRSLVILLTIYEFLLYEYDNQNRSFSLLSSKYDICKK